MIPLLLLAAILGLLAVLVALRRRTATFVGLLPAAGRGVGPVSAGLCALALTAAFVPAARGLVGLGLPPLCQEAKPAEHLGKPSAQDALKAEAGRAQVEVAHAADTAVTATGVRQVSTVTGSASPNETLRRWHVWGTDLGHMFTYRGRLGLLFGDTFAAPDRSGWRSNVLAWSDGATSTGIPFTSMHSNRTGDAVEILGSIKQSGWEQTTIPTNAVTVGGRIVVHYMSVRCWGRAGSWSVNGAGLAYSDDGGTTWHRRYGQGWGPDSNFAQVAFVHRGRWVYAFGVPAGRAGEARLARVRASDVLDVGAWRYWNGAGWVGDESAAATVVPSPVGELSVRYDRRHHTWLMLYLDDRRQGVVMRTAPTLTGPWSPGQLVVSAVDEPQLYAPYIVPAAASPDDGRLYFTLSRFDIYNVVLMRAELRSNAVAPDGPQPPAV